jgi:hypothetical protein
MSSGNQTFPEPNVLERTIQKLCGIRLVACGPIVNRPSGISVPPFIYLDSISRLSTLSARAFLPAQTNLV